MRSTMLAGKVTFCSTHLSSGGSHSSVTSAARVAPLPGRLSQETTVSGPASAAARARSPATSRPIAVGGPSGLGARR